MDGELVPVLQIDTKKSPFYTAQPVLAFIQECGEGRNPEETMKIAKFRERVARELRGKISVIWPIFHLLCVNRGNSCN
ncbi:hypothetical protein KIN20_037382 [Parelaphostrongylus tenuis]|uniref:Uncharacterized protein n=1 Tax=Parelaphostrongylus tenuis TaxID=148309 RepID=A0AAD5RDW0_PARTN|nr:hypothetical protein KIN20_037382 [Parelaphostrongylus tenuis]